MNYTQHEIQEAAAARAREKQRVEQTIPELCRVLKEAQNALQPFLDTDSKQEKTIGELLNEGKFQTILDLLNHHLFIPDQEEFRRLSMAEVMERITTIMTQFRETLVQNGIIPPLDSPSTQCRF